MYNNMAVCWKWAEPRARSGGHRALCPQFESTGVVVGRTNKIDREHRIIGECCGKETLHCGRCADCDLEHDANFNRVTPLRTNNLRLIHRTSKSFPEGAHSERWEL